MKCPYCNEKMTEGYIQSSRKVFFTIEEHTLMIIPSKNDQLLTKNNWSMPTRKALCCPACKKVIVDYSEE